MNVPWQQRLWVSIYATLVVFTLLLAGIGLFTWEALNDFPMFTLVDHAAARRDSGAFENRPRLPPADRGPPPSELHRPPGGQRDGWGHRQPLPKATQSVADALPRQSRSLW